MDEFKITDDNYNRDGLLQNAWRNLFETDLKKIELKGFERREREYYYSDDHYSAKDVLDLLIKGMLEIVYLN